MLVVMEHASCRVVHLNVTAHPTVQVILHDRDAIFSTGFDASIASIGLEIIETSARSPKANSLCES